MSCELKETVHVTNELRICKVCSIHFLLLLLLNFSTVQPSGIRAAASAVVAASGAQPDSDLPAYHHSPFEYEDDWDWEDDDDPPEISNAGGENRESENMTREAYRYIISPGYVCLSMMFGLISTNTLLGIHIRKGGLYYRRDVLV